MASALRIKVLDSEGVPEQSIDFDQVEVADVDVRPSQRSVLQRAQTGKPNLAILGDEWDLVDVEFRIHGQSTTDKFDTVRTAAKAGKTLQVFPVFQDNSVYHRNCFLNPQTLLHKSLFAGLHRGNKRIRVQFVEVEKNTFYKSSQFVHFDFPAIAALAGGDPGFNGWFPTAPASWRTGTLGDDASSLEWAMSSGFTHTWKQDGAEPGLEIHLSKHNGPPRMRYDTSVQRAFSDLLWPRDRVAIYEFWWHSPEPDPVQPTYTGVFMAAPWTSAANNFYFQMLANGNLNAFFDDGIRTSSISDISENYTGRTAQYVFVHYPKNGSNDGAIRVYVDGVLKASVASEIENLVGNSSDNRPHIGIRNPSTLQGHLFGTVEIFNSYFLDLATEYPAETEAGIVLQNYEFFKMRVLKNT